MTYVGIGVFALGDGQTKRIIAKTTKGHKNSAGSRFGFPCGIFCVAAPLPWSAGGAPDYLIIARKVGMWV